MEDKRNNVLLDLINADTVEDLTSVSNLDEAILLNILEKRLVKFQKMYTNISSNVLIALNPYMAIPNLYGQKTMEHIKKIFSSSSYSSSSLSFNPSNTNPSKYSVSHIYTLTEKCFSKFQKTRQDQVIICCGQSGSGKTESARHILEYLCFNQPSFTTTTAITTVEASLKKRSSTIVEKSKTLDILATNTIIEAFGNAKTVINNNSSRFAKFSQVYFDSESNNSSTPSSSTITTYLLEKSRVTQQSPDECNYHIFYYMAANKNLSTKDFQYLKNPYIADLEECKKQFNRICSNMAIVGFSINTLEKCWDVLYAILLLGNLNLVKYNNSSTNPVVQTIFTQTAKLLGLEKEKWEICLLKRQINIRSECVLKDNTADETHSHRDAVCRLLYEYLFQWIIYCINTSLEKKEQKEGENQEEEKKQEQGNFIGILDVFGFESFTTNSFEQLCINYTNETLQQFFNKQVLQSEQEEYLREGILWTPLPLPNNEKTVDLLAGRPNGIFSLLDSASIMPNGNAQQFVNNVFTIHQGHSQLKKIPIQQQQQQKKSIGFSIVHYAGVVQYDATLFLQKNADTMHIEALELLRDSKNSVIYQALSLQNSINDQKQPSFAQSQKRQSRLFHSTSRAFIQQVHDLAGTLEKCGTWFIRCLNSNPLKKSLFVDQKYIEPQVRNGGLQETIRVLKHGFPVRKTFSSIADSLYDKLVEKLPPDKYLKISRETFYNPHQSYMRNSCEALLKLVVVQNNTDKNNTRNNNDSTLSFQFGLTKMFFKSSSSSDSSGSSGSSNILNQIETCKNSLSIQDAQFIQGWIRKRRQDRLKHTITFVVYLQRRINSNRRWRQLNCLIQIYIKLQKRLFKIRSKIKTPLVQKNNDSEEKKVLPAQTNTTQNQTQTHQTQEKNQNHQNHSRHNYNTKTLKEQELEEALHHVQEEIQQFQQTIETLEFEKQELKIQTECMFLEKEKAIESLKRQTDTELQILVQKEQELVNELSDKTSQLQRVQDQVQVFQAQLFNLQELIKDREENLRLQQEEAKLKTSHAQQLEKLLDERENSFVNEKTRLENDFNLKIQNIEQQSKQLEKQLESKMKFSYSHFQEESKTKISSFQEDLKSAHQIIQQQQQIIRDKDLLVQQLKEQVQTIRFQLNQQLKESMNALGEEMRQSEERYDKEIHRLKRIIKKQEHTILGMTRF